MVSMFLRTILFRKGRAEGLSLNVDAGFEKSTGLTAYADNRSTILSYLESNSGYARLNANYKDFVVETSYVSGNLSNASNFQTYDLIVEYNLKVGDKLRIKPLLNYRDATFDDQTSAILLGRERLTSGAAGLTANYHPNEKWRVVLGGRLDTFNNPSGEYFSYQSAVTYKPKPNILFRAGVSRAYRAPLFGELYFNERTTTVVTEDPPVSILTTIKGNPDLKLVRADLVEVGMRLQISERTDMNVGIFRSQFSNYAEIVRQQTGLEISPAGEITGLDDLLIQNTDLRVYTVRNYNFGKYCN